MKGIVFNLLEEMVEEQFGFSAWEKILESAGSDGLFIATETYPDTELLALVGAAEQISGIPGTDLVRAFGAYMIPAFARSYPVFFDSVGSLKDFLLTVDQVIHVEVRKLYPNAGLPEFAYDDPDDNRLVMHYRSERKLCALAEGLIQGSGAHFGEAFKLRHDVCMHDGADHCELEITLAP